jgi:hypothetical protein
MFEPENSEPENQELQGMEEDSSEEYSENRILGNNLEVLAGQEPANQSSVDTLENNNRIFNIEEELFFLLRGTPSCVSLDEI